MNRYHMGSFLRNYFKAGKPLSEPLRGEAVEPLGLLSRHSG